MVEPDRLLENLARVRSRIAEACERSARDPSDVTIVAAAKTVAPMEIAPIVEAGVVDVGENYVRELRAKHGEVTGARWHFIGTLQSGTAHHVAALADVVQTLASAGATERLARRAAAAGRRLRALIEVDLTGQRAGVDPGEVVGFVDRVIALEGLEVTGLMTLPPIPTDPEDARPSFVRLRELRDRVRERHPGMVDLSMGMSLDYAVAVEEGATMVRIGTALFGPRAPSM